MDQLIRINFHKFKFFFSEFGLAVIYTASCHDDMDVGACFSDDNKLEGKNLRDKILHCSSIGGVCDRCDQVHTETKCVQK